MGKVIPGRVHSWSLEKGSDYELKLIDKTGEQGEWWEWRAEETAYFTEDFLFLFKELGLFILWNQGEHK